MGDDFIKFYVCTYNRWNPYSVEVQNIPMIYWILQFHLLQLKSKHHWENEILPHAELIVQLTAPENYKIYAKERDRNKKIKRDKDYYKEDLSGIEGGGEATAKFDPRYGLVDMNGNIIVPKDKYAEMTGMNIDGIAISW